MKSIVQWSALIANSSTFEVCSIKLSPAFASNVEGGVRPGEYSECLYSKYFCCI